MGAKLLANQGELRRDRAIEPRYARIDLPHENSRKIDKINSEGGGTRTLDQRIKSPLLYRLSYALNCVVRIASFNECHPYGLSLSGRSVQYFIRHRKKRKGFTAILASVPADSRHQSFQSKKWLLCDQINLSTWSFLLEIRIVVDDHWALLDQSRQ